MAQETEQFDQLPPALIEHLRRREHAVSVMTPAVDRAVLAAAREQFSTGSVQPPVRRRWVYPAAAAAAAAIVALFVAQPFEHGNVDAVRLADDVDGSGRVDVLDVFALARARAGDPAAVRQNCIDEVDDRIVALGDGEAVL